MAEALIIGICGGTGAGKTTLTGAILAALSPASVAVIQLEHYYKDFADLPLDHRGLQNFDHPDSFDLPLLVEHVEQLRAGKSVDRPVYDFARHERSEQTLRIDPRPAVMVEGILVFEPRALREMMDFKIFVEVDADVRFIRRLDRDIRERGRTLESVVQQYFASVRPMHIEFVEPSKCYADVIISGEGSGSADAELIIQKIRAIDWTGSRM